MKKTTIIILAIVLFAAIVSGQGGTDYFESFESCGQSHTPPCPDNGWYSFNIENDGAGVRGIAHSSAALESARGLLLEDQSVTLSPFFQMNFTEFQTDEWCSTDASLHFDVRLTELPNGPGGVPAVYFGYSAEDADTRTTYTVRVDFNGDVSYHLNHDTGGAGVIINAGINFVTNTWHSVIIDDMICTGGENLQANFTIDDEPTFTATFTTLTTSVDTPTKSRFFFSTFQNVNVAHEWVVNVDNFFLLDGPDCVGAGCEIEEPPRPIIEIIFGPGGPTPIAEAAQISVDAVYFGWGILLVIGMGIVMMSRLGAMGTAAGVFGGIAICVITGIWPIWTMWFLLAVGALAATVFFKQRAGGG